MDLQVPQDLRPGDMVHYQGAKCPGDTYAQVLEVSADQSQVRVVTFGVGKWISTGDIRSAVRPTPSPTEVPSTIIDIGRIRTKL